MVTSRDQTAGRGHNIKLDCRSFDWVEQFKYLGKTLKDQNSAQEEIKSSLKSGNACLSFGAESFVYSKIQRRRYTEL